MGVAIIKWDEATAAARLRNRRRLHILIGITLGLIVVSIVADHLRARNSLGDDWARFDNHRVVIVRAIDGESITVHEESTEDVTTVKLLGIKSFARAGDIDSELAGEKITLHLAATQTRDDRGRLLADATMEDGKPLSAQLAAEGLAIADRDSNSMFKAAIARAMTQARHRKVGMWADQ